VRPLRRTFRRIHRGLRRRFLRVLFETLAHRLGREPVLCLGDSHARVFHKVHVPGVWFHPCAVGGATASGVMNPNSASESLRIFTERLEAAPRSQTVLLLLGEVDCGFLMWHRAKRRGLDMDQQLSETLDAYAEFIGWVVSRGFRRVLVLSAPLPTIGASPQNPPGAIAKLRADVTATLEERTQLTMRFNDALEGRSRDAGAIFIDATSEQLDPRTGVVATSFLNENPRNHHLAQGRYSELIARKLASLWDDTEQQTGFDGAAHGVGAP
jgi:hypothetical protein